MDVVFDNKSEVPMYQNIKVKCEPVNNTAVVTVSVIFYLLILLITMLYNLNKCFKKFRPFSRSELKFL